MSAYAVDSSIIQRQSPKSCLDRVSTGSGSDLVCDQHAIFFDQVATLYMKGRPSDVSLELFKRLQINIRRRAL